MNDGVVHPANGKNVDAILREQLAESEAVAETVLPTLRHLVAARDSAVFSDEILAHVRGMLADLVEGFLVTDGSREQDTDEWERLMRAFIADSALLSHLHALALEWQLVERLQARLMLDPVLPPLLQSLVSSSNPEMRQLAMAYLAAQTRWSQAQRRMAMPIRELPGDLVHRVLLALHSDPAGTTERAARAEANVRQSYDESATRLGLAGRLLAYMPNAGKEALSITHAGPSLFLSAVSLASGQARDATVFSTVESQIVRMALSLRAAGLDFFHIEEQVLVLHPGVALPDGLDELTPDQAAVVLALGSQAGHHDT